MHIQVILGSTRENRFGDRAVAWVMDRLSARDDMTVELVDLRDHPLPFFEGISPVRTLRDYPSPEVRRFGEIIDRADGFVIVSPEYNHGYSGVLKNAMDHIWVEFTRKPLTFVGWGNVGGARAIEQLRLVAVEFEMAPLRHAVHLLPDVLVPAITAPEPFDVALLGPADGRLTAMADELVWWAKALRAQRDAAPRMTASEAVGPLEIAQRLVNCFLDPARHPAGLDAEERFAEVVGETVTLWHAGWQTGDEPTTVVWPGEEYAHHYFGKLGRRLAKAVPGYELVEVQIAMWGERPALTQTIAGTLPDGTVVRLPQMHILGIEDGKLVRIDTFVHEPQVAALAAAIVPVIDAEEAGHVMTPVVTNADPRLQVRAGVQTVRGDKP